VVEIIWLAKSRGLTVYFQPHYPVQFLESTRQIGQIHRLVSCAHSLDPFVQITTARHEKILKGVDRIGFPKTSNAYYIFFSCPTQARHNYTKECDVENLLNVLILQPRTHPTCRSTGRYSREKLVFIGTQEGGTD